MNIGAWICSCSSAASSAPSASILSGGSSTSVDAPPSSSSASQDAGSSLHTNLSLQTLPSVPSLQKLSPDTLNLSVTHRRLAFLKPCPAPISFLALHHNLLYAASRNQINVFRILDHTLVHSFSCHRSSTGSVKSIAFANSTILTSHQDCKIRVWQLTAAKRYKLLATLPTVKDILHRFIFPANYVKVRRHRKRLWIQHNDAVSALAVTQSFVCSVSWDKCLKIWRLPDFRCVQSINAHDDAINAVVVSCDGTIYTASADRRVKVWARPYGERRHGLVATLEKHRSSVNAITLTGDGSVLFSGSCDRSILVWEREDSANHMVVTGALRGHGKAILCLINVSDLLLSGSADRTVRIWQRGYDGRYCCLTVLDGHERPVKSLAAVRDGEPAGAVKVFSGSFDGEIKVWQVVISNLNNPLSSDLKLNLVNS